MAAVGRHHFIALAGQNSEQKIRDRFHCLRLYPDGSGAVGYKFLNQTFHVEIEQPRPNNEKT
jgi:hypothetical protein